MSWKTSEREKVYSAALDQLNRLHSFASKAEIPAKPA